MKKYCISVHTCAYFQLTVHKYTLNRTFINPTVGKVAVIDKRQTNNMYFYTFVYARIYIYMQAHTYT